MTPDCAGQLPRVFRLADWTIERDVDRLRDDAGSQHVEPKAMDVLCCLAAQAGQTVSREELLDAVWHERDVGEEVLTRVIGQLRAAMHDDPRRPEIIQTVPRRGYRLLVAVESAEPPADAAGVPLNQAPPVAKTAHWRWIATGLAACLVASLVLQQVLAMQEESVAVLPFRNLSGDPSQDYLSESVADNLITALSRLPQLRVSSRGSSFAARQQEADSRRLGEHLGVTALVEGSLIADSDGLAMTARLIDTRDGSVLWSFQSTDIGPLAQQQLQRQLAEQLDRSH